MRYTLTLHVNTKGCNVYFSAHSYFHVLQEKYFYLCSNLADTYNLSLNNFLIVNIELKYNF